MDYEKAYKEALERAKEYIEVDDDNTMMVRARGTMFNIFPELAESDDERIRKELIEQVQFIIPEQDECDENGKELPCYHERIAKYVAYLEKQKEQKSREDIINETVKDKAFTTKLLKSAGIVDETGELAEMYRSGQKPAEWSKEDEGMLQDILIHLEGEEWVRNHGELENLHKWQDWLKSLPNRFNLQSKQEWSEEDKETIELIATHLDNLGNTAMADILRNLRPQPHWKPSEEQMNSLLWIIENVNKSENIHLALNSLYEQLKSI